MLSGKRRIVGLLKVHGGGKITIPKEVRDKLRIEDGIYRVMYEVEGKLLIEKARISPKPFKHPPAKTW